MFEVGAQLKKARTARGLSIRDIAHTTRVPRASLEAIETGDREALPASVFVRGFVRAYALEVGLDPVSLLEQLETVAPPAHAAEDLSHGTTMPSLDRTVPSGEHYALLLSDGIAESKRLRFGPAALVAIALAMFFAAWLMAGSRTDRGPSTADPNVPALHQNHVDGVSTTIGLDPR